MRPIPLGLLPTHDPLYRVLRNVLWQELGLAVTRPSFAVFALDRRGMVYRYRERQSKVELVCKFYGNRYDLGERVTLAQATALLWREYTKLRRVRSLGLSSGPYQVVRPLAIAPTVNAALVLEYVDGISLDHYLRTAVGTGQTSMLAARLAELASFLAVLHRRSQSPVPLDPQAGPAYLQRILDQLRLKGVLDPPLATRLNLACGAWASRPLDRSLTRVLVHGDLTPVNLIFGTDHKVIALDLERLRDDDPALDLGMLAGELYHAWLRGTGQRQQAACLIEGLLSAYQAAGNLSVATMQAMKMRMRPYLGTTLLRIARNNWLEYTYRQQLCREAEQWLW